MGFFGFFGGFLRGKIGAKLIGLILGSIGVNLGQFLIVIGSNMGGWVDGFSLRDETWPRPVTHPVRMPPLGGY